MTKTTVLYVWKTKKLLNSHVIIQFALIVGNKCQKHLIDLFHCRAPYAVNQFGNSYTVHPKNSRVNSFMLFVPIDKLHAAQIGRRLLMVTSPPAASDTT